jgi:predicted acylesterase/phospholipase RssA
MRENRMAASLSKVVGYLAVGVLIWSALLLWQSGKFQSTTTPPPLSSRIVSLELANSGAVFDKIIGWGETGPKGESIGEHNARVARLNTWLDFGFIALYCSLLYGFAALYSVVPWWSSGLKLFACLAALLDILENLGVLLQLDRVTWPALPLLTHDASLGKWSCFFLAMLIAGWLLLRHRLSGINPVLRILDGALLMGAGALWMATFDPAVIQLACTPLALGLLLTAALFLSAPSAPLAAEGLASEPAPKGREADVGPVPEPAQFSPGGGGDDAVCFTAGPVGAYFGAGVIHSYLAARRKHPVVAAGISAGALSAAAMQKCYRELQKSSGPVTAVAAQGAGAAQSDATQRWSWLRVYLRSLTDRPLAPVWDSLPDMSDFFADMPPVRDSSLPQPEETYARRQRYILIKLGRRLATLPLSVRRVTETVIYLVRSKERYGRHATLSFLVRALYLGIRLCGYLSAPVRDNLYRIPRQDGKEPSFWATRPLFGFGIWTVAALVSLLVGALALWGVSSLLLIALRLGAFQLPVSQIFLAGSLAAAALGIMVLLTGLQMFTPEYPVRDKLWSVAKLATAWAVLWLAAAALLARWSPLASGVQAAAGTGLYGALQQLHSAARGLALSALALLPILVLVHLYQKNKSSTDSGFLFWAAGILLENVGLSKSIISDFYIMQRIKQLFDPLAVEQSGYLETVSDTPMPILLVAAPLQSLPLADTGKMGSQQVWPTAGANLAEALRASLAMPGLLHPVTVDRDHLKFWLDLNNPALKDLKSLDLVDGGVIRQNPLPALFSYLARHKDLADRMSVIKPAIHVVFNVPLEPRHGEPGRPLRAPSNIVDVGLLSLKLAKRRDTNMEVQQTNFLSKLERLVIEAGGQSALPGWKSSGGQSQVSAMDTLPLSADTIAPEEDLNVGPGLSPEHGKTLKAVAAGCRQSLQRLYADDLPVAPAERPCRELLAAVWERNAGAVILVPDPPGLPEVCAACTGKLCRPAQPARDRLNLSHTQFPELTGSQPRVVFVASGGVFRGAFQVGVLAALLKAQIKIDLVVGASVGTLMGGALAAAASGTSQSTKDKVIKELVTTFLKVDEKIALTAVLKAASRELGVRGRSIQLSPRDVQRMIHRGSRFDPGFAVAGAPPALLDALSTMFVLPYEDTKDLAAAFVAGHITTAVTKLLHRMREETLARLGIEEYLMGVSLLHGTAERLLFPDGRSSDSYSPQPYLRNGCGVALFGTTTNLLTWQVKLLGNPGDFSGKYNFIEAALSSSAFPAVFQPRRETDVYPGQGDPNVLYSDGGMFDNLPFIPAISVLTSVQSSFSASQPGASEAQRLADAYRRLQNRHAAPDLFIVGSLDAEPDSDPKQQKGPFDSILSVHRRASLLNANLKISDFQLASLRVHDQVGRLLRTNPAQVPAGRAPFLDAIVDAAVLPVFPADRSHLNPTFAFCRTLGLEAARIQKTVSDGCFQTLAAIAKAQAFDPKQLKTAGTYQSGGGEIPSAEDLLSKSVWALFAVGKLPYLKKQSPGKTCKGDCPFFTMSGPGVAGAQPAALPPATAPIPCPFAEAKSAEMTEIFLTCTADKAHKHAISS